MDYVWLALAGGAAAFPHCLGMCGGFALHLSAGSSRSAALARQLLWHAGRTTTYAFLGALAGYFGVLTFSLARWPWTRALAGYVVGAVMILMGLALLGVLPSRRGNAASGEEGFFAAIMRRFFSQPTAAGALALGVANGFLPCPITLAFLALAAKTHSVGWGMAIMAAMGLGTVWGLLLLGMTGRLLSLKWRRWGAVAVGALLIAFGCWTVMRKAGILPSLPGGPAHAQVRQGADCCR